MSCCWGNKQTSEPPHPHVARAQNLLRKETRKHLLHVSPRRLEDPSGAVASNIRKKDFKSPDSGDAGALQAPLAMPLRRHVALNGQALDGRSRRRAADAFGIWRT